MKSICPECQVGPGSFEGEGAETAILDWYSSSGFADDVLYDDVHDEDLADGFRLTRHSRDLFIGPLVPGGTSIIHASVIGYCSKCLAVGAEMLVKMTSAIFWIDDNGFRYSNVTDKPLPEWKDSR